MNAPEAHKSGTKSDLLRRGCRDITEAGPAHFLEQSPLCVFAMGGCHVFAVALHKRLSHHVPDLRVFHLYDAHGALVHVVVGRQGGPYSDVGLRWVTLEELAAFWERDHLFPGPDALNPSLSKRPEHFVGRYTLQVGDAVSLCLEDDFITGARLLAEKFLDQECERLDALGKSAQKEVRTPQVSPFTMVGPLVPRGRANKVRGEA